MGFEGIRFRREADSVLERDAGFLWDPERELVDAHVTSSGSRDSVDEEKLDKIRSPVETKSKMKGTIASPAGLEETLAGIRRDLERVEMYHQRVRDQPGGRWEWSDKVLPRVQSEVEKISNLMDSWEHEANREGRKHVRNVLSDALNPLHAGLDDLKQALDGGSTSKEIERARSGHADAPGDLVDDFRELKARRIALLELLKYKERRVIFQYIATHEGEELPDREKGKNSWKWWASTYLETEYGLIKEGVWEHHYSLTERGELVDEVLWKLEQKPLLELLGEGRMSTAEASLKLLPHHINADEWAAWKEVF